MTATARPIFDAIVTAAVDVTAATVGWLLMIDSHGTVNSTPSAQTTRWLFRPQNQNRS